jgi:hypothetical protein
VSKQAKLLRYSKEQIQWVKDMREAGFKYKEMVEAFNEKFQVDKQPEDLRNLYRNATTGMKTQAATAAKLQHPHLDFVRASLSRDDELSVGRQRYFITAVSPLSVASEGDCNVHRQALATIDAWCERRGAQLVLLPLHAHLPALKAQPQHYAPVLRHWTENFYTDLLLNDHLRIVELHLNPQQKNPLHQLGEVDPKRSIIVAHSTQQMKCVAYQNNQSPRMLHSTGCLTWPEYLPNRAGRLAEARHCMGGLVVEVDNDIFHLRQVQFADDGSFIDLGVRWLPDGSSEPVKAAAVKLGDVHVGHHSYELEEVVQDLVNQLEPTKLVVGDLIDHISINPHLANRPLSKAKSWMHAQSLYEEYVLVARWLRRWAVFANELIIEPSNHHDWLINWLERGDFASDPLNVRIGTTLARYYLHHQDPLRTWFTEEAELDEEVIGKLNWPSRNTDLIVEGVQLICHSDLGPNGAKGSAGNLAATYPKAVGGHTHSPEIAGGLWRAGHLSHDRHGYNKGPSNWLPSVVVVYPGGFMQNINIINGSYTYD